MNAFRSEPGFRSLRFGDVIDVHPAKDDRSGNSIMAGEIASVLSSTYSLPEGDDLLLRVEVALTIADALLARAFSGDRNGDSRFIEEARAVVRSYFVQHYGEPTSE